MRTTTLLSLKSSATNTFAYFSTHLSFPTHFHPVRLLPRSGHVLSSLTQHVGREDRKPEATDQRSRESRQAVGIQGCLQEVCLRGYAHDSHRSSGCWLVFQSVRVVRKLTVAGKGTQAPNIKEKYCVCHLVCRRITYCTEDTDNLMTGHR